MKSNTEGTWPASEESDEDIVNTEVVHLNEKNTKQWAENKELAQKCSSEEKLQCGQLQYEQQSLNSKHTDFRNLKCLL